MELLRARLYERQQAEAPAQRAARRKNMIGGAGRAEKIRTYRALLSGSSLMTAKYYRGALDDKHYEIKVPVLTRKERLYLDAAIGVSMHATPSTTQDNIC